MNKQQRQQREEAEREQRIEQRRQQDVQHMLDRQHWPKWPWLPLKRWVDGQMETAVLHADEPEVDPRIHFINVFAIRTYFPTPDMRTEQFANLRAIVDAGWMVD